MIDDVLDQRVLLADPFLDGEPLGRTKVLMPVSARPISSFWIWLAFVQGRCAA